MTFGGGYAMLPILQREVVEKRAWATEEEMADYYAVGQCTPGIIAVNVATFLGNRRGGVPGAVAATLGQVFPSLVIISVIAGLLTNFADFQVVQDAFSGIRACVCVLIFNAVLKLFRTGVVDKATLAIFVAVLLAAALTNLSPVVFVLAAGVLGVLIRALGLDGKARQKKAEKGADK
jgi:chromate transporter